jgi:diguanylate cyclase (GGDEF)-like protein
VGDQCLQQVASLLAEVLRREDDRCPLRRREFALLLPCTTLQGAMQIAEQVRTSLRALGIPHHKSRVSGAGQLQLRGGDPGPDQHHSIAELIQKADAALYQAKHNGRDRIEVALMGKVA